MKLVNIVLFGVVLLVALILANIGIQLTDTIPLLQPNVFLPGETQKQIQQTGMWFWIPVAEYLSRLVGLVLPAVVGVAVLVFAEKRIFPRQADMQKNVAPVFLLLAAGLSVFEYSTLIQWIYVFGGVIIFGFYSLSYHIFRLRSKTTAA